MLFCVESNKIEYLNNSLTAMFDITHGTFRSEPAFFVNHVVHEDVPYLRAQRERLMGEQRIEGVEFRVKQHDGKVRMVSANAYVVGGGEFIIGIFKDITESREHESYIVNYGAKKDTLLEMVTHNLSAPLMLTRNMIDSMERLITERNVENIGVHVQLIKENTRHCIELVNDFLEEEHLVSERINARKSRINLIGKITTVFERFQKAYPEFNFVFLRERETLYINTDDVKLLQVINNLVSNAIKWSPVGGVIEIRVVLEEASAVILVRDHGVGIPDDIKPAIFEKHTRASRAGLRGEISTGMGLYIVKALIQLIDGEITFESREGEGTVFRVRLPLA